MKKLPPALAIVVLIAMTLTACGGSDSTTGGGSDEEPLVAVPDQPSGVLDKAALAKAADANCTYQHDRLGTIGIGPLGPNGAAAQYEVLVPLDEEVLKLQKGLEPAADVAKDWRVYLAASADLIGAERAYLAKVAEFAKTADIGDQVPGDVGQPVSDAIGATYDPADALGLKVCTYTPSGEAPGSGTKLPDGLEYPEPKDTIDQAGKILLAALKSGSCQRNTDIEHSDNGPVLQPACANDVKNVGKAKIIGTESYGPAGAVETFDEAAKRGNTFLMVEDADGMLKRADSNTASGGGLRPPNPGYDAQETMEAAIAAIRDSDAGALDRADALDSSIDVEDGFDKIGDGPTAAEIVSAIRDSPDAEPVLIGANQAFAVFLIDAGGRQWVLENVHQPGSETHYAGFSWWPID